MGCQDQRNFVLLIYQQLFYTCCFNTNKISKTKTRFWSHSTAVTADSLVQNQEALKYFLPVGLKYFFRNAGNIFPAWLATIHTGLDWRARKCCCQNHVGSVTTLNIWRPILLHSEKKYVPWHIYFPHHSWSNLDMGVSVPLCQRAEANICLNFASFSWHCLFSSWILPFFLRLQWFGNAC